MKKITLALLVLFIALPLMAGDEDNATLTISGDATTTFGVDLDTNATGFQNALNAKLQLDFKLETSAVSSGMDMGPIYGEVKIDEISIKTKQVNNADDNDADLEMDIDLEYAKIMGANWWVSVKGHDDSIDYENATQNGIIGVAAAWDGQMDNVSNDAGGVGGFEAGLTLPDIAAIEVSLFSLNDWTSTAGVDEDNAYGLKASVALKAVPDLTLEAAFNMPFGDFTTTTAAADAVYDWEDTDDDPSTAPVWTEQTAASAASTSSPAMGFGGKVAYKIAVGDISITPEVGVDAKMLDGGGMNLAIGNGLTVGLGGSEVTAAEDSIKDDAGTSKAWDDGVNDGLTLGWSYYMPDGGDASLGLQAHVGIGMIDNLNLALGFEASDLMAEDSSGDMGLAVYGDYAIGDIKPFAGVFMLLDNEDNGGSDGEAIVEAGVSISNIVPKTTLTVQYNSGNLLADDTGDELDPGILQISVKVAY
jgi:hypothetical protein